MQQKSLKAYLMNLLKKKTSKIYINFQSAKIPIWILKEDKKDFI